MSSENYVGIIMAENLRFLGEGSSAQGKSGAKARPRGYRILSNSECRLIDVQQSDSVR